MSRIELQTLISAPPERCFDLARSVELHLASTARTREHAIAGTTSGLLELGDGVTWRARHFGVWFTLSIRISAFDPPTAFRDEMVSGPFRSLVHDHRFEAADGGTRMRDLFVFSSGFPPLDRLVLAPYLRRFLEERNEIIRRAAETEGWRRFLPAD